MTRNTTQTACLSPFPTAEEELADFFPSVALLPEQFFSSPPEEAKGRGERALMRAVLEDAIFCFQTYRDAPRRSERRLAHEAEAWVWAEDYRWPFSFCNICQALGLNPDYIRLGMKRWIQQGRSQRQRRSRRAVASQQALSLAA